jgi:L-asparaginase
MAIRILVCGGTFDKKYDEITGRLFFKDTHVPEMLRLGRSRVDVTVQTLMMVDSLDMTDTDRAVIVHQCQSSAEDRIVITARHGHDDRDRRRPRPGHRDQDRCSHWGDDSVCIWQL